MKPPSLCKAAGGYCCHIAGSSRGLRCLHDHQVMCVYGTMVQMLARFSHASVLSRASPLCQWSSSSSDPQLVQSCGTPLLYASSNRARSAPLVDRALPNQLRSSSSIDSSSTSSRSTSTSQSLRRGVCVLPYSSIEYASDVVAAFSYHTSSTRLLTRRCVNAVIAVLEGISWAVVGVALDVIALDNHSIHMIIFPQHAPCIITASAPDQTQARRGSGAALMPAATLDRLL